MKNLDLRRHRHDGTSSRLSETDRLRAFFTPITGFLERVSLRPRVDESQTPDERPMALYSYEVLSRPDNIRTIRLHGTKTRIECSFEQISVSEEGYQALSYVWGNPEKPFRAIVLDSEGNEIGYIPLTASSRVLYGIFETPMR
jgi:hypothetical protein